MACEKEKDLAAMISRLQSEESQAETQRLIAEVEDSGAVVPCRECGKVLSAAEIVYYETRCEQCEADWTDDASAYMKGESLDPETQAKFDGMFGGEPTVH